MSDSFSSQDASASDASSELDTSPMEPVLPPEGVIASRMGDVLRAVPTDGPKQLDVAGVAGSAAALFVGALAREHARPVVVVVPDVDAARKLAEDVGFALGGASDPDTLEDTGAGDVLVFLASESSPYADVNPDRRAAMSRMAVLAHLASGKPWRVLVVPAQALVRRVVPHAVVRNHCYRVVVDDELDRDGITARLTESGYLRVPVVEDPGSFAIRGALFDVWPPSATRPLRVELYGDMVLSIRPFDADDQRTRKTPDGADDTVREVFLPPVREAVLTAQTTARARARVRELADAIDWPTSKASELVQDVANGRAFFGADAYLPAYYESLEPLLRYVKSDAIVALVDPPDLTRAVRAELERAMADTQPTTRAPRFAMGAFYVDEAHVVGELAAHPVVGLHRTLVLGAEEPSDGMARFEVAKCPPLHFAARDVDDLGRAMKQARASRGRAATMAPLARRVHFWREHGLRVFLVARAQTQAERLAALLQHQGLRCRVRFGRFDPGWLVDASAEVEVVTGPLSRGVVLPADGLVVVTEEEIFGARVHRRQKRASNARPFVEDLRSLAVGDFVVHAEHGIGRYQGLVHKQVGSLVVDLLVVEYAAGDKLYLPVHRLSQIQKYAGGENAAPKLDRLGGSTFAKTKARVATAVRQMADDLLRLYAERKASPGHALEPAGDDYRAFEATFPFEETSDQSRAIDEVNRDLEAARPMDRLVCGDVGFGKTEVAIRAAYRVAMAGRQVAILCPTTVLAQQHFRVLEARMQGYPVVVRAMSRFQSAREQDETLAMLKDGTVDIVVGTHRLLSKDIHFKTLGLLVVDEEQRFGVAHKERIKQLRAEVDVLTLTATPIPRTLQMAVSGLRDLSLITTPPVDRRAVRTVVTRFDEQVIREAVTRELSRGGQIFYVYNRVEGIYEKAHRLQVLFPSARIGVGHGQMARGRTRSDGSEAQGHLEQVMVDFVEGRYDMLVATAIVENGLDIPRANTILIDRADLFGLSQLYQLRGRVGRSKERAYAYLIVPAANAMTDEARSRIEALERHTELGSGFQIATLDLELRGAGDLLGGEQSGNVASVGFDMFCQMLEEAVHELRGEVVVHDVDPELSFDVEALLPESYVAEVGVRLSLYKRLSGAEDEAHVAELATEMEDRFGPPPDEARRLVQLMTLKSELRRLKVLGCEANARVVTLHLREDTPLDPAKVSALVRRPKSPYRLTPDMRLSRRFEGGNGLTNAEAMLAELAKSLRS